MQRTTQLIQLAGVLLSLAMGAHAQKAVGRWNLGEQDSGAVAGGPGDALTKDFVGTNDLAAAGAPLYSGVVPTSGGNLSMSFDGASYYQGSLVGNGAGLVDLYSGLDFNNFSLSCDVKMAAPGAAGFSFPVSIGLNGAGIAMVEISGKWHLIHQGVAASAPGPAVVLDTWAHLDLIRRDFGSGVESRLFIDGSLATSIAGAPNTPTDYLTIGANQINTIPGTPEGFFQGLVDNVVITNFNLEAPPSLTGIAVAPATIYTGNSILLSASGVSGDLTSRGFAWRRNGAVVTNTTSPTLTLLNATTNLSGTYDVVVTNLYGGPVTSVTAVVTVQDPSLSAGADVAKYRLGEDDPNAVAGSPGNAVTKAAIGTSDLEASGSPTYSENSPTGGGALSMSFDEASFYRSTNMADVFPSLDFGNFSLSLDAYVTALGSAGFSFPISMGKNGGGFAIVEISGKWYILHQTVGQSAAGFPVALETWTHLELQRRQFGATTQSRLFVNGVDVEVFLNAGPTLPIAPILTLGANSQGDEVAVEGNFNGLIDNVLIHDYSVGARPIVVSGPLATVLPGPAGPDNTTLLSGASLILTGTGTGGSPLTMAWRKNGVILTNMAIGANLPGSITISNATAGDSGTYDFVLSNQLGSATSSTVTITVLPPGTSRPTLLARYRMGEDDPGAVAGGPASATAKEANGTNDLTVIGAPFYDANVPNISSTLSTTFDGATFYQGDGDAWTAFYSVFDFNNFSLSCDVFMTAPGAEGFSFPVSIGGAGGGLAVVGVGGFWQLIHHGITLSAAGPEVALNTWTHLELLRQNFGTGVETRLFIDGVDAGIAITGNPGAPRSFFFVGGNRAGGPEGYFNGQIDNVELHSFTSPTGYQSIRLSEGQTQVGCQGRPGGGYTLWRTLSLNPATWTSVTNAVADATGHVQLVDPAPPPAGAFYRTSAP